MSQTQAEKFAAAAVGQNKADKPARGWQYYAKRFAIYLGCGYITLCIALYFLQKRLLYRATKESPLTAADHGFAPQQARDIQTQTKDGVTLHGWIVFGQGKKGGAATSLADAQLVDLFFCGSGGNRGYRDGKFRQLTSLGATIVSFDYRGYGDNAGTPDEQGIYNDAHAAWDYILSQNVSPQSVVIHGESLGGAVAVNLAGQLCKQNMPPGGLVIEASFARLRDAAANNYPFIPVSLILNQRFPSAEWIQVVECPIFMMHGRLDKTVPLASGRELFDKAPASSKSGIAKEFIELPTSNHNDIGPEDADLYRSTLKNFYAKLAPELGAKAEHAAPKPHVPKTKPQKK